VPALLPRLGALSASLNLRALSVAEGLRAALSVAVIIALNEYFHWPPLIWTALAAFNVCMCDPGGQIRRRIPVLLTITLLTVLIVGIMGPVRAGGIAVALPVGLLAIFLCSFGRIYGTTAQLVGVIAGVLVVLALDRPVPDVGQAALLAVAALGGCLWAIVLTVVIWRVHPTRPARRAIANVYRALATLAGSLRALLNTTDEVVWDRHDRSQLGAVRTTIEAARNAVTDLQRHHGGPSEDARHGVIRLEAADQLLGALVAAGEALRRASPQRRAVAEAILDALLPALLAFADAIVADTTAENRQIEQSIAAIAASVASLPEADLTGSIGQRVVELLRITYTLAVPANFLPGAGLDGTPPDLRQRLLQPLRANLNWRSPAFRHALRLTATVLPALAFTMLWFTPYNHWLSVTIVMTMQPYFGLTYTRVLYRIAGTLAGGLVAALVGVICTTPMALAIAMFPLAAITLAARELSYGLFITWLTPLIVLIVDISLPDASEWVVAGMRALFTVVGGAMAVAGCFLLWPNFEPQRLRQQLSDAIAAHGRYGAAVLSDLSGDASVNGVERLRREAGIASNDLETSISRTLAERAPGSREALQAADLVDAALRRCAGRLTAIALDPAMRTALPQPAWRTWRDWIAQSSAALASGDTRIAPRPGKSNEAVARIGRQFELIAGTLERLSR
jgi:uncharacterized membrane protein YccC